MPTQPVVLIAEEDQSVLRMLSRFFRKNGYEVFAASNSTQAVEVAGLLSQLNLVVSDRDLPGLGARDLFKMIGDLHPNVQIVFTSTAVSRLFSARPSPQASPTQARSTGRPTLTKPFRLSDLVALLDRLPFPALEGSGESCPVPASPRRASPSRKRGVPSAA